MAAELTFKNVLSHIQKSGLNFSIYLTPFSAKLSLKKSFAKKFYHEPVDEVVIEENVGHSLEAKVEQLESRLKTIYSEYHKLVETLKEREEALAALETKCDVLEETIKVERKKSKKERQKAEKKSNIELATNIKLEPKEETEEVITEVVTSNKFEPLISISDQDERDSRTNESIDLSENRRVLSFCAGTFIDIMPEQKISKAVQTSSILISQVSTDYEKYSCFYCEKEIASKRNLLEHSVTCHGAAETPSLFSFPVRPRPLLFKCAICGLVAISEADIINHKKSVHTDQ